MPIIQYRCEDCGNRFDAFFRSAEDPETIAISCAECGSGRVKGMFTVIGEGVPERAYMPPGCGECGSCDACESRSACALR